MYLKNIPPSSLLGLQIECASFAISTLLLGCFPIYSTATRSLNAGLRGG